MQHGRAGQGPGLADGYLRSSSDPRRRQLRPSFQAVGFVLHDRAPWCESHFTACRHGANQLR